MKDDQKYIDLAIDEILNPKFETTKQYLEVCELEYQNGKPKIARINKEYFEDKVAIYFQVKDEKYFIEVHLTSKPKIEVDFVWTESGHKVYLTATSKTKSFQELSSYINLSPLKGWSIGERENFKGKDHDFSRISYEPIENLAYGLDEKLELLLKDLEKNAEGVIELTKNAYTCIAVCKYQYISGNAGIGFQIETINRLNKLNLGIDIDTYIYGNAIKD